MVKKILILLVFLTLNLGYEGIACDHDQEKNFLNKIKKFVGIKKNTQNYPLSDEQMDHIRQTIENDRGSVLPDGQVEIMKKGIEKLGSYGFDGYIITKEAHVFKQRSDPEGQKKQGCKEVKCWILERLDK